MTGTGKATIETFQRLLDTFNAHDLDLEGDKITRKDSYWKLVGR